MRSQTITKQKKKTGPKRYLSNQQIKNLTDMDMKIPLWQLRNKIIFQIMTQKQRELLQLRQIRGNVLSDKYLCQTKNKRRKLLSQNPQSSQSDQHSQGISLSPLIKITESQILESNQPEGSIILPSYTTSSTFNIELFDIQPLNTTESTFNINQQKEINNFHQENFKIYFSSNKQMKEYFKDNYYISDEIGEVRSNLSYQNINQDENDYLIGEGLNTENDYFLLKDQNMDSQNGYYTRLFQSDFLHFNEKNEKDFGS